MSSMVSLPLVAALALVATAAAVAVPAAPDGRGLVLKTSSRVADFNDVAHTFKSQFKFAQSCPDTIVIKSLKVDQQRNIGSVSLTDISEDGNACKGTGTSRMSLVSEATVKQNGLLAALGFPKAAAGLDKNPAARATVDNSKADSSLLVGFDEGSRTCGTSTYDDTTFFFFISEPALFKITITTGIGARTSISIPPNTRSLFVTGPGNKLCLLSDMSTMVDGKVTVTTTAPGVSETPAPSKKPSPQPKPAAAKPSATPSPPAKSDKNAVAPVAVPGSGSATATASPSATIGTAVSATPLGESPVPESSPGTGTSNSTNGGSVCFPASGAVELASGKLVTMADLRIGDRVRTGVDSFSDVFLFTHRDAEVHAQFVRLVTAAGSAVTLTKSHYLYANGALVSAGSVRNRDVLQLADGRSSPVKTIEDVSAAGLYNPQTVDGNIVVDGVVASAYTTAVHPRVAHGALLAPLRALYEHCAAAGALLDGLTGLISGRADKLSRTVPGGPAALA